MPKVDMDMATGRITSWSVAEGTRVKAGDPLFVIETDKAAMDVDSPADGVVHHIHAEAGTDVPIGQPVAWIYVDGETVGPPPNPSPSGRGWPRERPGERGAAGAPSEQHTSLNTLTPPPLPEAEGLAAPADRPRATPHARRLARERGVDLRLILGSGPRGRIARADVEAYQTPAVTAAPEMAGPLVLHRSGGGPGTPVLLLHGFAADSHVWARVVPLLPCGHAVIKLDLPGHGRSPARSVGSFRDLARLVVAAFDRAGFDRVHVVGHSLGGGLALALADVRARRLASLTLIAPAGLGPEMDGDALFGLARASRAESLAPWLRRLVADPGLVTDGFVHAAMLARADPSLRTAQQALADCLFADGVQCFDLQAALQRVAVPTKLLWGRADRVFPWRQALHAPGRVALHLLDDIGHVPHLEAPDIVAALIADLATLDQARADTKRAA